jgi:DNA-binding GntR family transcriptional regulator
MSKYPFIKATLKHRLLSGHYREGEPIPSEARLAAEFNVSRMTARRAVDELEREGYIFRVQGSGSYPTGKRFRQGVFRIQALDEIAAGQDSESVPYTRIISAGLVPTPADVAGELQVAPGVASVGIVRVRGLERNGEYEPVILEKRFLRLERAERILKLNLSVESLHDILVGRLGLEISRVEQSLETTNIQGEEASALGLNVGQAAFLMRRWSFCGDEPLGFTRYWVRGDKGAFVSAFEP